MRRYRLGLVVCTAIALFGDVPASGQAAADQAAPRVIDIASHVTNAAQRFGIPEGWIYAVMRTESAGRIGAVSPAGAMGLMQLMPGTWARQRARFALGADPFEPRDNILAGASYLREMYDSYGASGFLAAYNAGPGRYEDWRDRGRPLPAETRAYVAKIAPVLQSGGASTVVASAAPLHSARTAWTQSRLFAVHANAGIESPHADIAEVSVALPLASSRQLGGLFARVSGSRSQ